MAWTETKSSAKTSLSAQAASRGAGEVARSIDLQAIYCVELERLIN
jgi:hypothetical protein